MSTFFNRIRAFDAYSKPLEDFRVKTLTGGAVTLVSGLVIVLLFISELQLYMTTEIVEELFVDSSPGDDRVDIAFDLTFPALSCSFITVDAMDVSGEHQSDVQHSVYKTRLDKHGKQLEAKPQLQETNRSSRQDAVNAASVNGSKKASTKPPADAHPTTTTTTTTASSKCLSCYGAEYPDQKCCNTCEEVKDAYRRKGWALRDLSTVEQCRDDAWANKMTKTNMEGCNVKGTVKVAKVAGNFHIAPGETLKDRHSHVHDLHSLTPESFNTSHVINHLSIGSLFPGKEFPLDGKKSASNQGGIMFQYYIKIVPTMYVYTDQVRHPNKEIMSHQFSVTTQSKQIGLGGGEGLPGFFIQYEFSPLLVKFSEKEQSLSHFLVSLCAIIGGVFTVASLFDSLIYHSSKILQQKIDIGKAG